MQVPCPSSGAGVPGPVSQLPHLGCASSYTEEQECCISALGAGTSSSVMPTFSSCNLWPQVLSLSCLRGIGQGIPYLTSNL